MCKVDGKKKNKKRKKNRPATGGGPFWANPKSMGMRGMLSFRPRAGFRFAGDARENNSGIPSRMSDFN